MLSGLLLPDRNNEPLIWAQFGGIYPIANGHQFGLHNLRYKWVHFMTRDSAAMNITPAPFIWEFTFRGEDFCMKSSLVFPTVEQQRLAGWTQTAVWSTIVGRVLIQQQVLDDLRNDPGFKPDYAYEGLLRWNPSCEEFQILDGQELTHYPDQARRAEQLRLVPWNPDACGLELRRVRGVIVNRTPFGSFVACVEGTFLLSASGYRHGHHAPDMGVLIDCLVRPYANGKRIQGQVVEYEVLPLPGDMTLVWKLPQREAKYRAVVEVQPDRSFLHPVFGKIKDSFHRQRIWKAGERLDVEIGTQIGVVGLLVLSVVKTWAPLLPPPSFPKSAASSEKDHEVREAAEASGSPDDDARSDTPSYALCDISSDVTWDEADEAPSELRDQRIHEAPCDAPRAGTLSAQSKALIDSFCALSMKGSDDVGSRCPKSSELIDEYKQTANLLVDSQNNVKWNAADYIDSTPGA